MVALSKYEVGNYQASRGSVMLTPKGYLKDGTKRGIIICHGAGELSYSMINYPTGNKQAEASLIQQIASVYPCIIPDLGIFGNGALQDSDNWGGVNAQAEMDLAITRLLAGGDTGGGAKAGSVVALGISMGHTISLTYAQASAPNAARIKAIVGILPVNDIDDIRDNNRGGYRASISTAWGTGAWVSAGNPALPGAANPAVPANQTRWAAIPQKLYYASDDAICTPATVAALVANVPIITTVNMGVGGHTDVSIGHVSVSDIMAFLATQA